MRAASIVAFFACLAAVSAQEPAGLAGRVIDEAGQPAAGLVVIAVNAEQLAELVRRTVPLSTTAFAVLNRELKLPQATTGPGGAYRLEGLEPGTRTILVIGPGGLLLRADDVAIGPGETTRDLRLAPALPGHLTILVRSDGRPIPVDTEYVLDVTGAHWSASRSHEKVAPRLAMEVHGAGPAFVRLVVPGFRIWEKLMTVDAELGTAVEATLVPIEPGEVLTGSVAGVLVDSDGQPMPGRRVGLVRLVEGVGERRLEAQSLVPGDETDDQGVFRIENVPPGAYVARAALDKDSQPTLGLLRDPGSEAFEVTVGQMAEALIECPPYGLAAIELLDDATGQPVRRVAFEGNWRKGDHRGRWSSRTGDTGEAWIRGEPGRELDLVLTVEGYQPVTLPVRLDAERIDRHVVRLRALR